MPQDLEGILLGAGGSYYYFYCPTLHQFSPITFYIFKFFLKYWCFRVRLDLDLITNLVKAVVSLFYIFRSISGITNPVGILKLRLNAYRDHFWDLYANALSVLISFMVTSTTRTPKEIWTTGFAACFDKIRVSISASKDLSFFTSCKIETA